MNQIIEEMQKLSSSGEPFALATVIDRSGSAPRSAGARMLVRRDGGIVGTVGGGILEAQVQRLAARMIEEQAGVISSYQFNGKDAAEMDAICGGQVEVLVEGLNPTEPQTGLALQGLADAVGGHRKSWWLTVVNKGSASTTHTLVQADGTTIGTLPVGLAIEKILDIRQVAMIDLDQQQVLIEPNFPAETAYIFGAGHVARSLAGFTSAVGFRTVVLDDRADFANRERYPNADAVIVLESFADPFKGISIDRDSFIVIVTRGHQNDLIVLSRALKTDAGYIGMIGSKRKCALIFENLRQQGYKEEDIQRVHAPIGIQIAAETPEEIGISIVAEMIQARARKAS
ncbi:xanthine and CO dehydrogenases maturation factor, XdhC/CoxF family [Longilinea arvoryzae]|uniref:Xanthine and CO dehydrogenases maturation factor, XdhC/CoxF family n=1 Tax=Longilinea arvoryzae TaxID=360412 RepID=A0A0K8MXF0_9CHLR|nr:XdhC/CoxI family protein [Longilinea arvoryzae]GAP15938.1 xanthine and CO dehydrogenases maturation factor, XdhC/CoxF family [Longilinea arvoryzae]